MSIDIPIVEVPATPTPTPVGNSTTIYSDLKGAPAFIHNRRNRAKNRAKIDKVNRNRKSLRILRNARKRQIAQEGHSDLPDTRLDASDRNEFAVSKPLFRGAKEAGRVARHLDRLEKAKKAAHERMGAYETELARIAALPEGTPALSWAKYEAYVVAHNKLHGLEAPIPELFLAPTVDLGVIRQMVKNKAEADIAALNKILSDKALADLREKEEAAK